MPYKRDRIPLVWLKEMIKANDIEGIKKYWQELDRQNLEFSNLRNNIDSIKILFINHIII